MSPALILFGMILFSGKPKDSESDNPAQLDVEDIPQPTKKKRIR